MVVDFLELFTSDVLKKVLNEATNHQRDRDHEFGENGDSRILHVALAQSKIFPIDIASLGRSRHDEFTPVKIRRRFAGEASELSLDPRVAMIIHAVHRVLFVVERDHGASEVIATRSPQSLNLLAKMLNLLFQFFFIFQRRFHASEDDESEQFLPETRQKVKFFLRDVSFGVGEHHFNFTLLFHSLLNLPFILDVLVRVREVTDGNNFTVVREKLCQLLARPRVPFTQTVHEHRVIAGGHRARLYDISRGVSVIRVQNVKEQEQNRHHYGHALEFRRRLRLRVRDARLAAQRVRRVVQERLERARIVRRTRVHSVERPVRASVLAHHRTIIKTLQRRNRAPRPLTRAQHDAVRRVRAAARRRRRRPRRRVPSPHLVHRRERIVRHVLHQRIHARARQQQRQYSKLQHRVQIQRQRHARRADAPMSRQHRKPSSRRRHRHPSRVQVVRVHTRALHRALRRF